jgi:two-component system, chemotaxis family, CheB/CheR fusion protein
MPASKSKAESRSRPGSRSQKKPSDRNSAQRFPIVGIGASAGGLKAFERFFTNMPSDSGIGFVLIPHLDPNYVSMLPDLLKKYTKMRVVQAEDGMKVERDCVHVIPPNTELVIMRGTLLLKKLNGPRGLRLPIDTFFRSLAEDQKDRAICIILSGNGTDGTLGLKAIKAELGMAMAQEPSSAEYGNMPRSAVETGIVDYVLPPDGMPAALVTYVRRLVSCGPPKTVAGVEKPPESLQKIFQVLRSRTGHDFSFYKKNTLCRRIERRMSVHQIDGLPDYVSYLERNQQEVGVLFKELLIGVTNFFRDPQAFAALGNYLLSDVPADQLKDYAVRVWVPGL